MQPAIQFSQMRQGGRKGVVLCFARLRRLISVWAAAAVAWHERRVALAALRKFDDRELNDIGIYRGQIDHVIGRAGRSRLHRLGWPRAGSNEGRRARGSDP